MATMASQITSLTIVYSNFYSGADQRKHQSSASLAFVRGIHRGPVNSPHKWPVTRRMFSFDDVIMSMKPDTRKGVGKSGYVKNINDSVENICVLFGDEYHIAKRKVVCVKTSFRTKLLKHF